MGIRRSARFQRSRAVCLLFSWLALHPARAQPLQTPAEPTVLAPRLKADPGVAYPVQALAEGIRDQVTVDLRLEVDALGRVTHASVSSPRGHGFDEAAVFAARQIAFEPATRDSRPVASRIKYRYVFSPPGARLVGEIKSAVTDAPIASALVTVRDSQQQTREAVTGSDGRWSLAELPAGPIHIHVSGPGLLPAESNEQLVGGQELSVRLRLVPSSPVPQAEAGAVVEVKGVRPAREVTQRTLTRDEIRHSAGTQGDALLSIQNLPGIARPPPFSGALVVRGSAPDDTRLLVDGTEVPLAYHFGGLSSVVPTELLEQIDFYPGNFGSRYGRAMGGIVEARLRAPARQRPPLGDRK